MSNGPAEPRQEYSYHGDLSKYPLPQLLYTISQYRVPGVLTFTNKQASKRLFVKHSRIIFAASNLKEDELGEFLFRCGKITRVQLDRSNRLLKQWKNRRQGQILVQMNSLKAAELTWAVRSHQQAIIWSLFNWFEGRMEFNIGNFKEDEPILLDLTIPRAILDGVRNIQQAKKVIGYIGPKETILDADEDALLTLEEYGPDEVEREIIRLIDGTRNLYDICSISKYGPHDTAKVLYGLWVLKLIRKKNDKGVKVISAFGSSPF